MNFWLKNFKFFSSVSTSSHEEKKGLTKCSRYPKQSFRLNSDTRLGLNSQTNKTHSWPHVHFRFHRRFCIKIGRHFLLIAVCSVINFRFGTSACVKNLHFLFNYVFFRKLNALCGCVCVCVCSWDIRFLFVRNILLHSVANA